MKLGPLLGVLLFGTVTIVGCAPSQRAQSAQDQVGTTQLTSADAPLPPPSRKPLVGWFAEDPPAPPKPRALDTSDPWSAASAASTASTASKAPAATPVSDSPSLK